MGPLVVPQDPRCPPMASWDHLTSWAAGAALQRAPGISPNCSIAQLVSRLCFGGGVSPLAHTGAGNRCPGPFKLLGPSLGRDGEPARDRQIPQSSLRFAAWFGSRMLRAWAVLDQLSTESKNALRLCCLRPGYPNKGGTSISWCLWEDWGVRWRTCLVGNTQGEFEKRQASGSKIAWLPLAAKSPLQKGLAGGGGGLPTVPGCCVGVRVLLSIGWAKGCQELRWFVG